MSGWRDNLYDFPDDGGDTLEALLAALPGDLGDEVIWVPSEGYRLRVQNVTSAAFLRMAVAGLGVLDAHHRFLEEEELYVPDHLRTRCERCLSKHCGEVGTWSKLIVISTATKEAQNAWERLYRGEWLPQA